MVKKSQIIFLVLIVLTSISTYAQSITYDFGEEEGKVIIYGCMDDKCSELESLPWFEQEEWQTTITTEGTPRMNNLIFWHSVCKVPFVGQNQRDFFDDRTQPVTLEQFTSCSAELTANIQRITYNQPSTFTINLTGYSQNINPFNFIPPGYENFYEQNTTIRLFVDDVEVTNKTVNVPLIGLETTLNYTFNEIGTYNVRIEATPIDCQCNETNTTIWEDTVNISSTCILPEVTIPDLFFINTDFEFENISTVNYSISIRNIQTDETANFTVDKKYTFRLPGLYNVNITQEQGVCTETITGQVNAVECLTIDDCEEGEVCSENICKAKATREDKAREIFEVEKLTESEVVEKLRLLAETEKFANATTSFKKKDINGEKITEATTRIETSKVLENTQLYLEIPKCMANHIDEVDFIILEEKTEMEVIQADPLVVWNFEKIETDIDLSYNVRGWIEKECEDQVTALLIAKLIGKDVEKKSYLPVILAISIIPLLGGIIIYFSKYKKP